MTRYPYAGLFPAIDGLTRAQALQVKQMRAEEWTWRAIADECWAWFADGWQPPSNQLAGQELCARAAEILGERWT